MTVAAGTAALNIIYDNKIGAFSSIQDIRAELLKARFVTVRCGFLFVLFGIQVCKISNITEH